LGQTNSSSVDLDSSCGSFYLSFERTEPIAPNNFDLQADANIPAP